MFVYSMELNRYNGLSECLWEGLNMKHPDAKEQATASATPLSDEEQAIGEGSRRVRGLVRGHHNPVKRELAKQFRREMTPQEQILWHRIRTNRLDGLHFRRQQIIDGFIADFYCHAAALVLEIDGSVHLRQTDYDVARDRLIQTHGIQILRIPNDRIEHDLKTILTEISQLAHSRIQID
jgi:very-short-patch-repair endonuclease